MKEISEMEKCKYHDENCKRRQCSELAECFSASTDVAPVQVECLVSRQAPRSVEGFRRWYEEDVLPVFAEGTYSTFVGLLIGLLDDANRRAQWHKDNHNAAEDEIARLREEFKSAIGKNYILSEYDRS